MDFRFEGDCKMYRHNSENDCWPLRSLHWRHHCVIGSRTVSPTLRWSRAGIVQGARRGGGRAEERILETKDIDRLAKFSD